MFWRRIDISSRQECEVNSKKLIKLEEKIIVKHILELNSQEFSFTYSIARDMTNKLLAKRQISPIDKNWSNNFVARTSTLKTRMNRPYDYKRAMCEDSEIIDKWFELMKNMKTKHDITKKNIYNFDETDFQISMISSQTVITDTDKRNRSKAVQSGDREWVTMIQGVNAIDWTISSFLIFKESSNVNLAKESVFNKKKH